MAREEIYTGVVANDGTGDTLRVAANKTNNNFSELYYHHANNLVAHDYLEAHTDQGIYLLQGRVNTTIDFANVIFNYANSVNANLSVAHGKVNAAFSSANGVGINVNSVYSLANTLNVRSVSTYITANASFNKANGALPITGGTITGDLIILGNTTLTTVDYVNPILYNTANMAYLIANTAYRTANSAFASSNGVAVNTTAAFARANLTNTFITNSTVSSNNYAGFMANGANAWSNTKLANSTGTFAGTLTVSGQVFANGTIGMKPFNGSSTLRIGDYSVRPGSEWNLISTQDYLQIRGTNTNIQKVQFFNGGDDFISIQPVYVGVNRVPQYELDVKGTINASTIQSSSLIANGFLTVIPNSGLNSSAGIQFNSSTTSETNTFWTIKSSGSGLEVTTGNANNQYISFYNSAIKFPGAPIVGSVPDGNVYVSINKVVNSETISIPWYGRYELDVGGTIVANKFLLNERRNDAGPRDFIAELGNTSNMAYITANAAFDFANTIAVESGNPVFAYNRANVANMTANLAYALAIRVNANVITLNTTINTAFNLANTTNAMVFNVNSRLNVVNTLANTLNITLNSAYYLVNTAIQNTRNVVFTGTANNANNLGGFVSTYYLTNTSLTVNGSIASIGSITATGSVTDNKGDVRNIPLNSLGTGTYNLSNTDSGKIVRVTGGAINIPNSIFFSGNTISIYNDSTNIITVSPNSSVTLRFVGTSNTGAKSLGEYGLATLICISGKESGGNTFLISGAGLY